MWTVAGGGSPPGGNAHPRLIVADLLLWAIGVIYFSLGAAAVASPAWIVFAFAPFDGLPTAAAVPLVLVFVSIVLGVAVQLVIREERWRPFILWPLTGPAFTKTVNTTFLAGLYLQLAGWFAALYLQVAHNDPAQFGKHLDHVGAAYFAITTLTTTGFGDIAPNQHLARVLVSIHMLLAITLIAVVIAGLTSRLLERTGAPRQQPAQTEKE